MQEHQAEKINEATFNLMKKIFGSKGQEALISDLEKEMVKKGKVPERVLGIAKDLSKLKSKVKSKKLTQSEMQRFSRDASELMDALTEYSQRKELASIEKGIMQITFEGGMAEVVATKDLVFVVTRDGKISKIEGRRLVDADKKELEKELGKSKEKLKFNLSSEVMQVLRNRFGDFSVSF